MSDRQKIKKLRAALKQVMDDCERGKQALDQWGPLSLKTIALIKETLAHG